MTEKNKKPFWNNLTVGIFTALLAAGTAIVVAIIGNFAPKGKTNGQSITILSPKQDTGVQNSTLNSVTQNENKGQIQNEFISGDKKINTTINPNTKGKAGPKEKNTNNGPNTGNIGGNNNTAGKNVVNGTNNGINGDVTVTTEPQFKETDKPRLLARIAQIKAERNISTNCINLLTTQTSNGAKFLSQIEDFLREEGYKITGWGSSATSSPLKGVSVDVVDGCIWITVGTL